MAKRFRKLLQFLSLLVVCAGCECMHKNTFTGHLWDSDEFRHFKGRDFRAPVSVHAVPELNDYVVTYTELREGDDKPRVRSYLLSENAKAAETHQKPHFTTINIDGRAPLPVIADAAVTPRAEVDTNIVIYTASGTLGPYPFPAYESSSGKAVKVALTPLAAVGDAGLVSLLAALVAAVALAHTGYSTGVH